MRVATLRGRRFSRDVSALEAAVDNEEYELAEFFLENTEKDYLGTSIVQRNELLKQQIKGLNRSPGAGPFIELLVRNHALDADKHRENGSGRTPLDEALTHGHKDVAKLLLEHGADVNYIQRVGDMSPLMDAITDRKGGEFKESMAFLCIEYGADLTYKDRNHFTVLDACTQTSRLDVLQFVIAANPMDMDAFKKALRIAFIQSRVPKPDLDKLILPKSMKARDMAPSVPILLRAIEHADLFLLIERARDIPRDPAPERGVGGAPAAAPESHGKPTAAEYDSIFGHHPNLPRVRDTTPIHRAPNRSGGVDRDPRMADEDDFVRAFGKPGKPPSWREPSN